MAGLADLFGGGMFGGGSLYGDMLTPEQKSALAFRGLMAAAGALGQAAMPSRMPVPLGAALGQAAGAMAQGQDEGALAALRAALVGQQGQALKQKAEFQNRFMQDNEKLQAAVAAILGGGGPSTAGPVAAAPAVASGAGLGGGLAAGGALAPKRGGVTLAEAKAAALRAGFDEEGANTITAITVPESSLNPNAYNPKDPAGGSFGLTQINGVHPGAREALGNVDKAMELAYRVSKGGTDFKPWAAYTSGAYKPYLAEASRIAVGSGAAPDSVLPSPAQVAQAVPVAAAQPGAGARGGLPPWIRFNSRGEPYNLEDAPGQQISAAQVTPDRMRALAQANAGPAAPLPVTRVQAPMAPAQPPAFGSLAPGGGVDNARMQALLMALAGQNASAEVLGMGNPYNSYISVLQGSPQYKAAIEAATRGAGLPFVLPEAYAKQYGTNQADLALKPQIEGAVEAARNPALAQRAEFEANLARDSERMKQILASALNEVEITVTDAAGQMRKLKVPRNEAEAYARGQGLPSLGVPPTVTAPAPGAPAAAGTLVPGGAAMIGEPTGVGQVGAGQRMIQTPSGLKIENIPGSDAARAEEERDRAKAQSADIVTQDIDRALKLSSGWTTGAPGSVLQGFPGTQAHDLNQVLLGIKGNVGIDKLQQMRQQSPTGGALGNVTEQENKILQATLGSLEQSQNKDQFEFNLRRLHNVYQDIVNGTPEKLAEKVREGKITPAQRDAALAKKFDLSQATPGALPQGVPAGSRQIGTTRDGKPVFEVPQPDGSIKRQVLQ